MWTAEGVLLCVLSLMGRGVGTEQGLPPIEFVSTVPADVSPRAEGFIRRGTTVIYLVTSSAVFQRAQRTTHRCGDLNALRKLASIIVHEEWHLTHDSDEAAAYAAQLTTLAALGAGPGHALYTEVQRASRAVVADHDRRRRASWSPSLPMTPRPDSVLVSAPVE
jgi:hypothetical protein